jgi:hypothetical protein
MVEKIVDEAPDPPTKLSWHTNGCTEGVSPWSPAMQGKPTSLVLGLNKRQRLDQG